MRRAMPWTAAMPSALIVCGLSGVRSTLREDPTMPAKSHSALFASIVVSCLLLACQPAAQRTEVSPLGSSAQITSISPDTTDVLRAGEQVKLKVDVSYVLTAESGIIKLVVLAADNSHV